MKKILAIILIFTITCVFCGCADPAAGADIVATTAPLSEFTSYLCNGTELTVDCLISESVSCLHDYTLQTKQMRSIEDAEMVIVSGAGLEDVFSDILKSANTIVDASEGITLLCLDNADHADDHHSHSHEHDPHIWLSPKNAILMVQNIYKGLCEEYPHYQETFTENLSALTHQLNELSAYAEHELAGITTREIITFHDGFEYMADDFGIQILESIEEEAGREASAAELIRLCKIVREHNLPCIFVEQNGSVSAAEIISRETKIKIYTLDMGMSGIGYFKAMYHNIDTLKEALK